VRAIVAGGGTGGHIYPALAIAKGLIRRGAEAVLYAGTREGLEAKLVPAEGLPFVTVTARKLSRGSLGQLIGASVGLVVGLGQAFRILRAFRPQVVIGTGGYVCAPMVLAASLNGIPTMLHEQNAFPGLANRLLASFASVVCTTFEESAARFPPGTRICNTGLPIRPEILGVRREDALSKLGLDPHKKTILAVGGSLGARRINEAMIEVLRFCRDNPEVQVIHATGEADYASFLERLRARGIDPDKNGNITIVPFLHAMPEALAAADLVIGRAGAAFLAELTARGVAAVLVPYPYAAENHQEYNARALLRAGACEVIRDRELTGSVLVESVRRLLAEDQRREELARRARALGRPEALDRLLDIAWSLGSAQ
jgi:UDP-N-acetylglucosamine--N-acetylmuramyl-(pentapeptide) pyrophosphoryl-undecaprenol N-acetylglucosamine transferase